MFGWEYPPLHSGGLGVACQGMVRGLLKNNVQVTLILPHAQGTGEENLEIRSTDDFDVSLTSVFVQSGLQPYDTVESFSVRTFGDKTQDLYGENLGQAIAKFTAMSVEATKDLNPDVVHCHDWMTMEAGLKAARHHGVPLICHVHATELDRTDFRPNPWIAERERMGLLASDHVIAVSDYTKRILVNHYGIPADKISVVHNGHEQMHAAIEHAEILTNIQKKKEPLILFLGRMTVQKNPFQFLEVARLVHKFRPDAQFVMAGEGSMLGQLMDKACELGLEECVSFAGKVSGKEATALYSRASCFLMPSLSEPFGLVALEAAHQGTPVIVSRQSGVAEVMPHAFTVDAWDADKMADCILTILREEELSMQLGTEGSKTAKDLTWARQASKINALYSSIITA